jgi:hypothetical protein
MDAKAQRLGFRLAAFFITAVCVYAIAAAALLTLPESQRDFLSAAALPFDLMVFLPLLLYFLVIRKFRLSPLLVVPVIALGGVFVFQIARPENPPVILIVASFVIIIDLVVAVRGFMRLAKVLRMAKEASKDPNKWFFALAFDLLRNRRIAKLLSAELSTDYYALCSWRKQPYVPQGARAFSYHKESGYIAIVGVVLCLIPVETAVIHLLLSQWSIEAAWIFSLLSLYSAIWLLGDCRASVLRPVTVSDDMITINSGIRFSVDISRSLLAQVSTRDPDFPKEKTVNLGIMGSANTWIVFSRDIDTETFFGGSRKTRVIGLTLDDASSFRELLSDNRDCQRYPASEQ